MKAFNRMLSIGAALSILSAFTGNSAPAADKPGKPSAPDFAPYMKKVSEKLGALWTPPQKTTATKVSISFTLAKDGSVTASSIKEPSGDPAVDKLALDLIKKAQPFAPLPANLPSFTINFNLPLRSGVTADGVDLNSYYDDIWQRIQKTWWVPKRLLCCQVKVKMVINKDGSLADASVAQSSGDSNADKLAIIGVRRAAPYKPLPEGVKAPFSVNYTIGYKNTKGDATRFWNGQKVSEGESYTTSGGTKMSLVDNTNEKDKAFHLLKENTLIKMADLDDKMASDQKTLGPDNPKLAKTLRDYAALHRALSESPEAEEKLRRALAIAQKTPEQEEELTASLSALGELEYSLGRFSEAEPLLVRAIALKEKSQTKDADYKNMLEVYAKLLFKENRTKEADEQYKKIKELG